MSLDRRHHSESGVRCQAAPETIGGGGVASILSNQLSLEVQLQGKCRELLNSYRESQDWSAVGQLAQTLVSNTSRINDLKHRLKELENHADLPYLASGSDNRTPHPHSGSVSEGAEEEEDLVDSTFQEPEQEEPSSSSSVGGEQTNLEKPHECLSKLSEVVPDKQPLGIGLEAECVEPQGSPLASTESKLAPEELSPSPEGCSVNNSKPEQLPVESEQEPERAHTPVPKQLEDTQPGEPETVIGLEDIDQIADLMENLADQFSHMSEQCEEPESHPPPSETSAELAVPGQYKGTDASSESSEQFFSPRDSLYYDGGESADEKDAEQFVDASSEQEGDADVPVFSVTIISEGSEGSGSTETAVYHVDSKEKAALDLLGRTFPPVVHSYQEFCHLHNGLAELDEALTSLHDHQFSTAADTVPVLEQLLNQVSRSPGLRQTEIFLNFFDEGVSPTSNCGIKEAVNSTNENTATPVPDCLQDHVPADPSSQADPSALGEEPSDPSIAVDTSAPLPESSPLMDALPEANRMEEEAQRLCVEGQSEEVSTSSAAEVINDLGEEGVSACVAPVHLLEESEHAGSQAFNKGSSSEPEDCVPEPQQSTLIKAISPQPVETSPEPTSTKPQLASLEDAALEEPHPKEKPSDEGLTMQADGSASQGMSSKDASPQPVSIAGEEISTQSVSSKDTSPQPADQLSLPGEERSPHSSKDVSPQPADQLPLPGEERSPHSSKDVSPQPSDQLPLPGEERSPHSSKDVSPQPADQLSLPGEERSPHSSKDVSPQPADQLSLPGEERSPHSSKDVSPQPADQLPLPGEERSPHSSKDVSPQPSDQLPLPGEERSPHSSKDVSPQPADQLSLPGEEKSPHSSKDVSPQPSDQLPLPGEEKSTHSSKDVSPQRADIPGDGMSSKDTSPQPLEQPVTGEDVLTHNMSPREVSPQSETVSRAEEVSTEVSPELEGKVRAEPLPESLETEATPKLSPSPVPEAVPELSEPPSLVSQVPEVSPVPVPAKSPSPVPEKEVPEVGITQGPMPEAESEVTVAPSEPAGGVSTQQESSEPDLVTESVPPSKEGSVPPAEPEANRETEQANMQPAAKEDAKLNPPNGQEMGILDGTESLERNLVEADSASLQSEGSSELTHQGGDVTTSAQEHTASAQNDAQDPTSTQNGIPATEDSTNSESPSRKEEKSDTISESEPKPTPNTESVVMTDFTNGETTPESSPNTQPSDSTLDTRAPNTDTKGDVSAAAASPEGSTVTSPSHSERPLESSTTSSITGTDASSTGPSSPERQAQQQLGQSMFVQGSNTAEESSDAITMSLTTTAQEEKGKKKMRKRQASMHDFINKSISGVARVKRAASQHISANKIKQESAAPSLMSPVMTCNWDPTCLLEELYSDFRPSSRKSNVSGESARYYGYLEKLPKNVTKASVMKGWKRRYFRVMDDKLFYYEDRTSPKALGFVRLSISRISLIPEKSQIHVQEKEKGGQSIMLRARDKDEASGWHRALMLEAAHPTVPATSSQEQSSVLIIDIGAASVRAGFAGSNAYPELFIPAVASIDSSNYEPLASGNEALIPNNRYEAHQVYPRKHSVRMDKHNANLELRALECIIGSVVTELDVQPEVTELILTLPPTVPEQQRNDLVASLFETFLFAAICFQDQCLLALYSYNTTSGVVVNIGDHIDIVPIIDGYKIESGVSHIPHGGNAITESLSKLVTLKGMRYFSETEMYIIRQIKEELCYISQNYDEDSGQCDANTAKYTRAADMDRFQLPDHRKVVALDVECFKAPEGLFRPSMWGKDILPLHELVWKSIQSCPIDQRREMAKKIFLSGGTCQLPGLKERLQKEVSQLATTGLAIEVHADSKLQHAAFLGASVLATLGSFHNYLVTREEFNSLGFEALRKWSTL